MAMKFFIIFCIVFLSLSVASCSESKALYEAEALPAVGPSSSYIEKNEPPAPEPADPLPDKNDLDIQFTKAFKALCGEAAHAADGYLNKDFTASETQDRLKAIIEKMVEEHGNLKDGDSATAGQGAIMIAGALYNNLNDWNIGNLDNFEEYRDIMKDLSEYS